MKCLAWRSWRSGHASRLPAVGRVLGSELCRGSGVFPSPNALQERSTGSPSLTGTEGDLCLWGGTVREMLRKNESPFRGRVLNRGAEVKRFLRELGVWGAWSDLFSICLNALVCYKTKCSSW